MDAFIEFLRFTFAILALIGWSIGHLVRFLLRLSGRRSEKLTNFLASTRKENLNYWTALGILLIVVLVAAALKTAFDRSAGVGWFALVLLVATGLTILWVFTKKRFVRVLLVILGFVAAFADFIFLIAVAADHGPLPAVGLLVLEIAAALGVTAMVSGSAFRTLAGFLGFLLFLAGPFLAAMGIALLEDLGGHTISLPLLGLAVVATGGAAPYSWWRDPHGETFDYVIGYVAYAAICLGSVAFVIAGWVGWVAIALLIASALLAVLLARRWPRGAEKRPIKEPMPEP